MEKRTLGSLISNTREERKITKTRLCRGLCTITALARYEQDIRTPDKFVSHALLERLGLNPFKYEFITSEQEFLYSMRREQIERLLCNGEIGKMLEAVERYEEQITDTDVLHIQYLLLKRAEIAGRNKEYGQGKKNLTEALKCTKSSHVCQEELQNIVLTDNEMKIIYLLEKYSYFDGEKEESFLKFQMLKNYIDKMEWNNEKRKEYYPHILTANYKIDNLYEIVALKKQIEAKIKKTENDSVDNFLIALKMVMISAKGKINEEGIPLWANTVNPQL